MPGVAITAPGIEQMCCEHLWKTSGDPRDCVAWRRIVHTQKGGVEMLTWIEGPVGWCHGDAGHQDKTRERLTILKSPAAPACSLIPCSLPR